MRELHQRKTRVSTLKEVRERALKKKPIQGCGEEKRLS